MKPSCPPKAVTSASPLTKPLEIGIKGGGCPIGTVPILRTHKEDFMRAKLFKRSHKTNPNSAANYPFGFHVSHSPFPVLTISSGTDCFLFSLMLFRLQD